MSGIFLRWGVPALVTVVGGTSLAISATSGGMITDLTSRAAVALAPQSPWAAVTFDGRDAVITGTATDQQMIDTALASVATLRGVRSVSSQVVLAEFVSPFPFAASIKDGAITLAGGVPDETAHAEILLASGAGDDKLRLLSGAPPSDTWRAAVDYGLGMLEHMDEGGFSLEDLEITIDGRARSPESFDALAIAAREPAPAGVRVVSSEITPALAAPFEWRASFDGTRIGVSGFTPTEAFADELRAVGIAGRPVSTSLVLASGAPENFEASAKALLENLVLLEQGTADISDATLTLTGAPPDAATAERIRAAMVPIGAKLDLAPPRVASYDFIATRTDGTTILEGHVPDAATRDRLDAMENVDAAALELARGAPERFDSAVEFGLDILAHLSDGRFTVTGTELAVAGRAATLADFDAVETTLALGAPQGLILAAADVKPPLATPFTWSAQKAVDGGVRISGFVPSKRARVALQAAVEQLSQDSSTIADGNPPNFEAEAAAALRILPLLESGAVDYDGTQWTMTGRVRSAEEAATAETAFAAAGLREAGWSFSLDLPAPPTVALPIIDPYVWRAQKSRNGTVTLGGFVPTDELKRTLVARAGEGAVDSTNLGAGFPDNFIPGTVAGLDALVALSEGTLGFDGRVWSLTGQVPTAAERLAVEGALQAAVDVSGWRIAIQALDAAPVVSPYRWVATKGDDGRIALSGYVTDAELKQFVAVRAGAVSSDTTDIASGEPVGFVGDVLAGLEALNHLTTGTVKYEAGTWSLSGVPQTAGEADLAVAALGTATSGGAGWQKQLSEPVTPPEPEPEPLAPAEEPAPPAEEPALPEQPAVAEEPAPTAEPEPSAPTEAPAEPAIAEVPETTTPVVRDYTFSASKPLGGTIVLDGKVPADATRQFFSVIAGDVPTDNVTVSPTGLPADFIPSADAGIRALASLDSGEFGLDGSAWILTGRVETEAERTAVLASIADQPAAAGWETAITLLPAIDVCRQKVAAFASRNAILFRSGSAQLAEESLPAVDELAAYLSACPEATVHVEGHTDADGADDLNLALSVARAETVVGALIERGIGYQRLYAVGYGESLPVADNDTTAGKRANRRIAFTILDQDE